MFWFGLFDSEVSRSFRLGEFQYKYSPADLPPLKSSDQTSNIIFSCFTFSPFFLTSFIFNRLWAQKVDASRLLASCCASFLLFLFHFVLRSSRSRATVGWIASRTLGDTVGWSAGNSPGTFVPRDHLGLECR